jgi:hypothetical protein
MEGKEENHHQRGKKKGRLNSVYVIASWGDWYLYYLID